MVVAFAHNTCGECQIYLFRHTAHLFACSVLTKLLLNGCESVLLFTRRGFLYSAFEMSDDDGRYISATFPVRSLIVCVCFLFGVLFVFSAAASVAECTLGRLE